MQGSESERETDIFKETKDVQKFRLAQMKNDLNLDHNFSL